jgi:choline dehydrogenase-like flavoprotein
MDFSNADIIGPRQQLTASKELILSAGVVGTPQILLNSGIGDPSELDKVGVQPVFTLPSVGKNFSSEPQIPFSWAANETIIKCDFRLSSHAVAMYLTFGPTSSLNVNESASEIALQQWIDSRTGPMTGGSESISAYFRLPLDSPVFDGNNDPSAGPNTPHFGIGVNVSGVSTSDPAC